MYLLVTDSCFTGDRKDIVEKNVTVITRLFTYTDNRPVRW